MPNPRRVIVEVWSDHPDQIVVKTDGEWAGKGIFITHNPDDAWEDILQKLGWK